MAKRKTGSTRVQRAIDRRRSGTPQRYLVGPATGGTGTGYNINAILPIQPAPLVGMQRWYDTI
jgi:hypothetical protein